MFGNDNTGNRESETRALNMDDDFLTKEQIRIQNEKEDLLKEFLGEPEAAPRKSLKELYSRVDSDSSSETSKAGGSSEAAAADSSPDASEAGGSSESTAADSSSEVTAAASDGSSEAPKTDSSTEISASGSSESADISQDGSSPSSETADSTQSDIVSTSEPDSSRSDAATATNTQNDAATSANTQTESDAAATDSVSENAVFTRFVPLPKFGNGGMFIPIVIMLTICGVILGHIRPVTYGIPTIAWIRYTYIGLGVILLFIGILMFNQAVSDAQLFTNIVMGKLVTTGIYAKTRNPMYGGILLICTSVLFFSGNTFMYILPLVYWGILTILMKKYEEPLLADRFGKEYTDYMEATYRFVPLSKSKMKEKGELIDKLP